MVTVISKNKFQQCFEFVMSFWPDDQLVQKFTAEKDIDNVTGAVDSSALFYDIYRDIADNMEFGDCRMVHIVNYGVFQMAKAVGDSTEEGLVSRDCIVADQVKALLNESVAWQVR